jgi:glycosyltransferase involved in cell wall biosynthesis
MADTLRERGLTDTAKLRVINNFMLDADLSSPGQDMPISGAEQPKLCIIFAGNIGRFQGLESIIDAMHLLQDEERVELLLVGGGVAKASLQIRAGDLLNRSVRFLEHKSQSAVERLIADSDVGLIALQAGVYRYAYPSKTATYMKLGCPLLVCMDKASELSEMVEREGLGEVCEPGDPVAIAAAIHKLRERKADLARRRARIIELGREMFGRDQALDKWSRLVKELAAAAHP